MYLKTLKIKGFKSFAKPVTLQFSKGLSVIVGPNGTGKSNIVDAIIWVLGEQNPRFLRGQTMQDVIFSGTEKLPPSPAAEVTLVFDNSSMVMPLDTPEVAIKRVVTREGSSHYFINEKPCRLIDIMETISHLNLGAELTGIVPQNRIYDLINPNSSDLKSIIEESSGVAYYRIRRDNATKKLRSAEEKLEKLKIVKEETERQLRPLKKQAEDYKKVLELKSKLEDLEIRKALAELLDLRERYEALLKEISAVEGEIRKIDADLENLEEKKKMLERITEKDSENLKLRNDLQKLKDLASSINIIKLLIEEKARNALEKISSQNQLITSYSAEISSLKGKTDEVEKDLSQLSERKSTLLKEQKELKSEIENICSKKRELNSRLELLNNEAGKRRREVQRLKGEEEFTRKQLLSALNEAESLKKEIERGFEELEKLENNITIKLKEKQELFQDLKETEQVLVPFQESLNTLKEDLLNLKSEYNYLLSSKKDAQSQLSEVEKTLESYKTLFKKIEDVVELSGDEMSLLQKALPHSEPLYVVYSDEIKEQKNLPLQFTVVDKEMSHDELKGLFEKIKATQMNVDKLGISSYFYHPGGFYYKSAQESGYYRFLERKKHLKAELEKLDAEIFGIEEKIKNLESEVASKEASLKELSEKKDRLKEELHLVEVELESLKNRSLFLKEEQERKKNRIQKADETISNLQSLAENCASRRTEHEEALRKLEQKKETLLVELKNLNRLADLKIRREAEVERELNRIEAEINFRKRELESLNEKRKEAEKLLLVAAGGVEFHEKRLKLLNRVHELVKEYADTVELLLSANAHFLSYEREIEKHAREIGEILESLKKLYERKSRLDSRLNILKNQTEELTSKIGELVKQVENSTLLPIDRAFEKYPVEKSAREYEEEIGRIKQKIGKIGDYNPFALRDFEILNERYQKIKKQSDDIKRAMDNLNNIIEEVDKKILQTFMESFEELNRNFDRIYSHLTDGGRASIIVQPEDNFEEARFIINVSQPSKKLKNINLLSGGEKSLTSLALLLALEETFKVPFMVFDEVEPALDEVNLERFIRYLKKISQNSQIIMVTHQPLTVEAADVIYGVTIDKEGSSRVYSLKLEEVEDYHAKL